MVDRMRSAAIAIKSTAVRTKQSQMSASDEQRRAALDTEWESVKHVHAQVAALKMDLEMVRSRGRGVEPSPGASVEA